MEKSKTRKMQLLLLTLILSIFALGGSLTAALAAEMVWDRTPSARWWKRLAMAEP